MDRVDGRVRDIGRHGNRRSTGFLLAGGTFLFDVLGGANKFNHTGSWGLLALGPKC